MAVLDHGMPSALGDVPTAVPQDRGSSIFFEAPGLEVTPGPDLPDNKLQELRMWRNTLASMQQEAQTDLSKTKNELEAALTLDPYGDDELPTLRERINQLTTYSRNLESLITENQHELEVIEEKNQQSNHGTADTNPSLNQRNYSPLRPEVDYTLVSSESPRRAQSEGTWSLFDDAAFAPWQQSPAFPETSDLDLGFLDEIFSRSSESWRPSTPPTNPSSNRPLSSLPPNCNDPQDTIEALTSSYNRSTPSDPLRPSYPTPSIIHLATEGVRKLSALSSKRGHQEDGGSRPVAKKCKSSHGVDFDELFEEGNAKEKHLIIEHPTKSDNWYIVKCECAAHVAHFGETPLKSAVGHATQHHKHELPNSTFSTIIQTFGVPILNCNREKADRNNRVFYIALLDGYKPVGESEQATRNRTEAGYGRAKVEKALEGLDQADTTTGGYFTRPQRKQRARQGSAKSTPELPMTRTAKISDGHKTGCNKTLGEFAAKAIDPQATQIYCVRDLGLDCWKAILVLPVPSFEGVAIEKQSLKDTLLSSRRPPGYEVNLESGGIELRGSAQSRMVPVMWFDDFEVPICGEFDPPGLVVERYTWCSTAEICRFDVSDSELPVVGLTAAQQYLKRVENLKLDGRSEATSPEELRLETYWRDDSSFSWYSQ